MWWVSNIANLGFDLLIKIKLETYFFGWEVYCSPTTNIEPFMLNGA